MQTSRIYIVLLAFCAILAASPSFGSSHVYSLSFIDGTFYGPGNMPDAKMPKGRIDYIRLNQQLTGETPFFNNADKHPNIESGKGNSNWSSGKLSDESPYNEYMDGGIVEVGRGALRMLNVVTKDGPNQGKQLYSLDKRCNWKIVTDLVQDPGFRDGIIGIHNLTITTGVVWAPDSLQSQLDIPGGVDSAGSLPSGVPSVGRFGDYDFDGYLDGTVVGAANIPINHIFYPGAPVVQFRNFHTDIPIAPVDAAALSVFGSLNYKLIFDQITSSKSKLKNAQIAHFNNSIPKYLADLSARVENAITHLSDVVETRDNPPEFIDWISLLNAVLSDVTGFLVVSELNKDSSSEVSNVSDVEIMIKELSEIGKSMRSYMSLSC